MTREPLSEHGNHRRGDGMGRRGPSRVAGDARCGERGRPLTGKLRASERPSHVGGGCGERERWMRIIANVFGARHVLPRVEALAGKVMAAMVAREARVGGDARSRYVKATFDSEQYHAARGVILDMLSEGPALSADMLQHVGLRRQQLFGLLGAMRAEGVIVGEAPGKSHAAVWRLADIREDQA